MLTAAGSALVEDDGLHKAQAALVLGGDGWGTRILRAAQLARAGWVPVVIVSGPSYYGGNESDFTIAYAERQGFPSSLFEGVPNGSSSTRSETKFFGQYLREHGIHKILLVTSNYHTHRAAWLMRKQNPGIQIFTEPASDPDFTPETWWKSRNGRKVFVLEWLKTFATAVGE